MKPTKLSELKDAIDSFIEERGDLPLTRIDYRGGEYRPVVSATLETLTLNGIPHAELDLLTVEPFNRLEL